METPQDTYTRLTSEIRTLSASIIAINRSLGEWGEDDPRRSKAISVVELKTEYMNTLRMALSEVIFKDRDREFSNTQVLERLRLENEKRESIERGELRGIRRRELELKTAQANNKEIEDDVRDSLLFANEMKRLMRDRLGVDGYVQLVKEIRKNIGG
jgi:hypothetical protein